MTLPENTLSVVSSAGAWLCAAVLTLRFYLVGASWAWLLPPAISEEPRGGAAALLHAAFSLFLGVPVSLLGSLLLAECGVASLGLDVLMSLLLVAAGCVTGWAKARQRLGRGVGLSLPGALVVFAGIVIVLHLPRCGEWILGGWDPGVYVNQGVCVGRTGTFHPGPLAAYADLTPEDVRLFSREVMGDAECFPGVPLDPDDRAVRHYFFRLTPTLVSVLERSGGLCAATRVNWLMGLLGLLVFAAFLRVNRCSLSFGVLALVLLVTQPLWLYHLHLPTSEMTELFLVLGLGTVMALQRTGWACRGLFLILLLAAILNRISFLPFAGLFVLGNAWADMEREDRRRVFVERLLQLMAIGAGAAFDFTITAVTARNLQAVVPELVGVAGGSLVLAFLLDAVAPRRAVREALRPTVMLAAVLAGLVLIALGAWLAPQRLAVLGHIRQNAFQIGPYLGRGLTAAALVGLVVFVFTGGRRSRYLVAVTIVFLGITLLLSVKNFVVPICPWATRRYVSFTLPLFVIASAGGLAWLWDLGALPAVVRRGAVVVLLGGLLASTAKVSWHALSRTEYDGVSVKLAEVAKQVGPRDVIVVDHFKWGAPLAFIHGKAVLNGTKFYGDQGRSVMAGGLAALQRLRGLGWTVRFLTSTPDGLGVYPDEIPGAVQVWSSPPFVIREIIHSPRARDFELREKPVVFRLYTMP